jgi:hypothetical protein
VAPPTAHARANPSELRDANSVRPTPSLLRAHHGARARGAGAHGRRKLPALTCPCSADSSSRYAARSNERPSRSASSVAMPLAQSTPSFAAPSSAPSAKASWAMNSDIVKPIRATDPNKIRCRAPSPDGSTHRPVRRATTMAPRSSIGSDRWQRRAPEIRKLAVGGLPSDLHPDGEEENRRESVVDEPLERSLEDKPSDLNAHARVPELRVACGPKRIRPSERHRRDDEQDDSASGVGREESLEWSRRRVHQANERPRSFGRQRVGRCGVDHDFGSGTRGCNMA